MSLIPTSKDLIYSRNDPTDKRLGEHIQFSKIENLTKDSFCLLGYPDDAGIRMNGGRPGANEAPNTIRQIFFKMTPDVFHSNLPQIFDVGNIQPEHEIQKTHDLAYKYALQILKKTRLISLGGGHDFGYPDAAAFLDSVTAEAQPLILNFDAHLDVRPTDQGFHSGTPFRRLLEKYHGKFDLIELGIQPQCNSREHYSWALSKGVHIISNEVLQRKGLLEVLTETLEPNPNRPLWLSLDIDAFTSNEAPGCSQSWPTGISIQNFLPALHWLNQNFDCKGLGLYEVSPPLDQDNRTSKLAALILHHFISNQKESFR